MHFNIRKSGGRKNRHLSSGARKSIQSSSLFAKKNGKEMMPSKDQEVFFGQDKKINIFFMTEKVFSRQ
jgi:hypothetical protein